MLSGREWEEGAAREGEKGGEKGLASLRVPAPGWRP